jgi:hypothetical protein
VLCSSEEIRFHFPIGLSESLSVQETFLFACHLEIEVHCSVTHFHHLQFHASFYGSAGNMKKDRRYTELYLSEKLSYQRECKIMQQNIFLRVTSILTFKKSVI